MITLLVLSLGMPLNTAPKKPKIDPNIAFANRFYAQIESTNRALENVVNLPCDVDKKVFNDSIDKLVDQVTLVGAITAQIPDNQPALQKTQELETTYGLYYIVVDFVHIRDTYCKQPKTKLNLPNI